MLVKTLRGHTNAYGEKPTKVVGDEYKHPSPAAAIKSGLVEELSNGNDSKDGGLRGNGSSPIHAEKRDGKKHRRKSAKKSATADGGTSGEHGSEEDRGASGGDNNIPADEAEGKGEE